VVNPIVYHNLVAEYLPPGPNHLKSKVLFDKLITCFLFSVTDLCRALRTGGFVNLEKLIRHKGDLVDS
jgi:hypothetical protein